MMITIKPQSRNKLRLRTALVALSGIALTLGLAQFRAQADQWDKRTVLTVNEPIQIRETLLNPGQYVLKLVDSSSDRHIVQIYNADQTHLINTVMAIPAERVQVTGGTRFAMWETPAGSAKALKEWFYPGDNFGQEFPYPKHLTVIAQASNSTYIPPAAAPAPAEPSIQPQASLQEPPSQQPPVEIAQNSPPPPPAPSAAPEPPPQSPATSTPAELPKTGSPYPLFGFTGSLLLSAGGLLRRKYSA
jgi:LPXTG-motif cell wall-anchored protein